MIMGTIFTVIAFIALYALCEKMGRDPLGWCILGIFITPLGAMAAAIIYTLILGDD